MKKLLFGLAFALLCTASVKADTIFVYAAGDTGQEQIQLKIHNRVVATWELEKGDAQNGDFIKYSYDYPYTVRPEDVRIAFPNDGLTAFGEDKNVRIDKIEIRRLQPHGVSTIAYQTEEDRTYSTGTWAPEDGCAPGFKQSEYLHCGGEFHYYAGNYFLNSPRTKINILAAGATGQETIELQYNGSPVARYENVGGDVYQGVFEELEYFVPTIGGKIPPISKFRVVFVNDGLTDDGRDKNVRVDGLEVIYPNEGESGRVVKYESESPDTLSTGSWDPDTGCLMGHKETEWLACNGYFEYFGTQDLHVNDRIYEVRIAGTTGQENVVITQSNSNPAVRGAVVKTYLGIGGSGYDREFITLRYIDRSRQSSKPQFDPPIEINSLQVAFLNDGLTNDGDDKNIRVDWIRLLNYDGTELDYVEAESQRVFSTGTWKPEDGHIFGYRDSEWLNCTGHMQADLDN